MQGFDNLISGYREFSSQQRPGENYHYRDLAGGQSPKVMVISCADSRVLPTQIFNAEPGELFVVRNVASVAAPYGDEDSDHGTSAAVEYAVRFLKVDHIVVMGHSNCGGVAACAANYVHDGSTGECIDSWLKTLKPVAEKVLTRKDDAEIAEKQTELEHATVKASVDNLRTFPFVQDGINNGSLTVHGAWFDIADGQLYLLDDSEDQFEKVD